MRNIILQQQKRKPSVVTVPLNFNQPEEISYFDAYLLPYSERANLQTALNTYGAVKLESGNYRVGGVASVNLTSNMKLYGHSSYNEMPPINITAGATNVLVNSVKVWYGLNFLSGSAITNCKISKTNGGYILGTNSSVENCEFVDIIGSKITINNTSSGYFRNNKFIKHWITSEYPQLDLKGNNTTPSYGNTWAWLNLLTAHGDATDINNFGNLNIVGLDAEAWNFNNLGTGKALLYMRNMNDVKLGSMAGLGYATNSTPVFDIQANNLMLLDKEISTNGGASTTTAKTLTIDSNSSPYAVTGGNYDTRAFFNDTNLSYEGSNQTALITGTPATNIASSILGTERAKWNRYVFATIANPTGIAWATNRIGQTSSRAYIQNLIDTQGIANLPEGIFYIDTSLLINSGEGIVGAGTGKTVIVGLTDDFNLINVRGTTVSSFTLLHMTLQGGNKGVHITSDGLDVFYQPNGINFKYVVFRNQATYGIEVAQMYGMDNNMFEQIHFFNIPTAFKQTPDPAWGGVETNHMTYIDKTVFYRCQVINCGIGFSLITGRADNLNAWIECNFSGNTGTSIIAVNHNAPVVINCDFKNNSGTRIIEATPKLGLYSCDFSTNSSSNIIKGEEVTVEGCNFLDAIPLFETSLTAHIVNSTVVGSVSNMANGMFVNSNIQSNAGVNYLLVKRVSSVNTILLNTAPTPYPQLLVTQLIEE
jgi:hypothetical protein